MVHWLKLAFFDRNAYVLSVCVRERERQRQRQRQRQTE